jgi:hypothetical protein
MGVRLPQGLLACELASVELQVVLLVASMRVRVGRTIRMWPRVALDHRSARCPPIRFEFIASQRSSLMRP